MNDKLTPYVNSVMDEVHELCSDLYEAMMDIDREEVVGTIKKLKLVLTDVQKSYNEEL